LFIGVLLALLAAPSVAAKPGVQNAGSSPGAHAPNVVVDVPLPVAAAAVWACREQLKDITNTAKAVRKQEDFIMGICCCKK
jgi:hypothetical protein